MVKQHEQVDLARQKKEEGTAVPRQEAMVKGITPAQPAPIPVERAVSAAPAAAGETSWFARMMSWFSLKPEAPAATPAPAQRDLRGDDRSRDGRRDARGGGHRRRHRRRFRNDGRGEARRRRG